METRRSRQLPRMLQQLPLLLTFLLLAIYSPNADAQNGGCVLHSQTGELIEELYWNTILFLHQGKYATTPLSDLADNNEVYYTFTNTENIQSAVLQSYQDYFKILLTENTMVITTGDNFKNSEKDWDTGAKTFFLSVQITCQGIGNNLGISLEVYDSNNYVPEITEESYTYKFTVPLAAGTELTTQKITGHDWDVTSQGVVAELEPLDGATGNELNAPSWFTASVATWDGRAFGISLVANTQVDVRETVSFHLRITDKGTEDEDTVQTKTATIIFIPDVENSVFDPRFQRPLYRAIIQNEEGVTPGGNVLAESIILDDGEADEVSLEDGGAHNDVPATDFVRIQKEDDKTLQLLWKEDMDQTKLEAFLAQPYALLVISVKSTGSTVVANTVVHLALPGAFYDIPTTPTPTECPNTCDNCPTDCDLCPTITTETPICPDPPECPDSPECPDNCSCEDDCPCINDCDKCPPTITENPNCPDPPECPNNCDECPTITTVNPDCPECPNDCDECPNDCDECPNDCDECPNDCDECPNDCDECPDTTTVNPDCPDPPECPNDCDECPNDCDECPNDCDACAATTVNPNCPVPPECPNACSCDDECPCTNDCDKCPTITTENPNCPLPPECPNSCDECPVDCDKCSTTTEKPNCPECPSTCSCDDECPCTNDCDKCPTITTENPNCPDSCEECPVDCDKCSTTTEKPNCPVPPECPNTCSCDDECPCSNDCDCDKCPTTTENPNCPVPPECPNDCDECPNDCDECPTECEKCPTTTTVPPTPTVQLEFEKSPYVVTLDYDMKVGDLVEEPKLKNAEDADNVVFSLQKGTQSALMGLLSINDQNGEVRLAMTPPPSGTYEYLLLATATGASPAEAQLVVRGPLVSKCSDGDPCFDLALDVLHVDESIEEQVLSSIAYSCDDCQISLIDGADFFSVDSSTAKVTLRAVDREAAEFGGAETPVLRLELLLSQGAGADARAPAVSPSDAGDRDFDDWAAAAENTFYNPTSTVVLVVVQDVNDNAPVFKPPQVVVGYPTAEIAAQLRPPALFTAQATDADAGENAELRYSLAEGGTGADYVQVHPETGAVHPRAAAGAAPPDGATLRVRATDRRGEPGDAGTNTGDLSITLRPLEEKHLVDLRVVGALPEEADALLAAAAAASDADRELRLLTATALPPEASDKMAEHHKMADDKTIGRLPLVVRARRAADLPAANDDTKGNDAGTELRLVLYSLKNGRPEDAKDFTKDLENALQDAGYEAEAEEADLSSGHGSGSHGDGDSSDSGLLAAVIVLAVLLGLALIGAGVIGYIFAIRPRLGRRQRLKEEDSIRDENLRSVVQSIEPLTEDMLKVNLRVDEPSATELEMSHSTPTEREDGEMGTMNPALMMGAAGGAGDTTSEGYLRPRQVPERHYEEIQPAPATSTADGDGDGSVSVDGTISWDGEGSPPPRKSVFFNEDVDCIEIRM